MCVKCSRAVLQLSKKGYSRDFIDMFLWQFTPFPVADPSEQLRRFLRVKRSERSRWMRKQENRMTREVAAIREGAA